MENITFDLLNMHRYGTAFYDYLKMRKQVFVDELGWDIPHNDFVEMDQYDNPMTHYSLVVRDGVLLGGARAMSTMAEWNGAGCMLNDIIEGKLPTIPTSVIDTPIKTPRVWECSRLVMAEDIGSAEDRAECLALIVDGLAEMARAQGADELMSLTRLPLLRALRQLGWACDRIGTPYTQGGRSYAVLSMPATKLAAVAA
ncbi:MAG: autoinducer synthase [Rhodobacteraceae bacterium]|nr:autoinducer synthase [Paracoccaceae bacterium]